MAKQEFHRLPVVSEGAEYLVMGYLMRRNILTADTTPARQDAVAEYMRMKDAQFQSFSKKLLNAYFPARAADDISPQQARELHASYFDIDGAHATREAREEAFRETVARIAKTDKAYVQKGGESDYLLLTMLEADKTMSQTLEYMAARPNPVGA